VFGIKWLKWRTARQVDFDQALTKEYRKSSIVFSLILALPIFGLMLLTFFILGILKEYFSHISNFVLTYLGITALIWGIVFYNPWLMKKEKE
jgi:hypothetical protein